MKGYSLPAVVLALTAMVVAGCTVNSGGGGSSSTRLLSRSGAEIPEGSDWLPLVFEAEAGRVVNVSVTANSDRADPDFRVIVGNVDIDDLDDSPISDLVAIAEVPDSPQESDSFTPEITGEYTLFITEASERVDDVLYSISVTQRD